LRCAGRSKQADELPLSSSNDSLKLSAGFQIITWKKPSPAALSVRDLFNQGLVAAYGGLQMRMLYIQRYGTEASET
jgi:hypothetical protein